MDVSLTTYEDALNYLFARTTGGFKFGLERTSALLTALDNPHRHLHVLHVAGTNGKGSCVATAEALLRGRGMRVARYTSPHLVDFRERIVVDGRAIPVDVVVEWIQRYTPVVERLGATFFEATTAMAFDWFARSDVDVALIETGLGGRLDSTNVVDPVAAGVTSIGLDHTEYLGDTLESIAAEKAGIFKPGRPAVIGGDDATIATWLADDALRREAAPVRVVGRECGIDDVAISDRGTTFTFSGLGERQTLCTPLVGIHQAWNVAFTLVLLDAAGAPFAVSPADAAAHLSGVSVPGRFQHEGQFIFDVAHNADGAEVLARSMASVAPARPVVALISVLRDKDWRRMIDALTPVVDQFIFTFAPTSPQSRAWHLPDVEAFARERGLSASIMLDFDEALRLASSEGATVLVTGSFHTVGDAMARLQVSPLPR